MKKIKEIFYWAGKIFSLSCLLLSFSITSRRLARLNYQKKHCKTKKEKDKINVKLTRVTYQYSKKLEQFRR